MEIAEATRKYPHITELSRILNERDPKFLSGLEFIADAVSGKIVGVRLPDGETEILSGSMIGTATVNGIPRKPKRPAACVKDVLASLERYQPPFLHAFEEYCAQANHLLSNFDTGTETTEG